MKIMRMNANNIELTISIVSFNSKDLLKRCLSSINKYLTGLSYEVIVVDNGSKDGTVKMIKESFSRVTVLTNKKNVFFAKANNQALIIAKGKYFLILNQDAYFIDDSIKKMIMFMDKNPDVGACEGLEIYENGKIVPTGSRLSTPLIDFYELSLIGKRIKNKRKIDEYRLIKKNRKDVFDIDVGCDAFLLVRKEILNKLSGYDENFLLYYTENDICLRIKKLGHRVVHYGLSKVMHRVSASVDLLGWKKMDIYYRDMFYYYKKHGFLTEGLVLFGLLKLEQFFLKSFKRNI